MECSRNRQRDVHASKWMKSKGIINGFLFSWPHFCCCEWQTISAKCPCFRVRHPPGQWRDIEVMGRPIENIEVTLPASSECDLYLPGWLGQTQFLDKFNQLSLPPVFGGWLEACGPPRWRRILNLSQIFLCGKKQTSSIFVFMRKYMNMMAFVICFNQNLLNFR